MQTEFRREDLGGGVGLITVTDPKFKTNCINVRFLTAFSKDKAPALALLSQVLSSLSADYPDSALMSRKLNSLYGSWVSGYSSQRGGIYEVSVSANSLCDRYALSGEKIFEETAEILLGCIFRPALENGAFAEAEFNSRKLSLLSAIDSEINDKRAYAVTLALETAYSGETSAERFYGSREGVEALTPKSVYEVYLELLKTAKIEITFSGGGDFAEAAKMFASAFATNRTDWENPSYYYPSPLKPEPAFRETELEVSQASLIMVFKTLDAESCALTVMCWLFGETPFSKLFLNVREKLSLCYTCSASYFDTKSAIAVVCGVDAENTERAKNEILRQLSLIAEGDFTDSELEGTKLALENEYRSIYDKASRLGDWYYSQNAKGSYDSPEGKMKKLWAVTREEVIAAAEKVKLDTVFVLRGEEKGSEQ